MFEGFLEKFLTKYFGEYLSGVDRDNLSVAVWKGEITVKTVDMNPQLLKRLGFPLTMIFGRIQSLLLRVPWNNLSSKPVELFIDSINLVLALEDVSQWYSQHSYLDFCRALLDDVKDEVSKKLEEELEKVDQKATFFEQIFDNLMISIKNIHIRIENKGRYCFGFVLADMSLRSVDSSGQPTFVKRQSKMDKVTKMITFRNLILYHDKATICRADKKVMEAYFTQSDACLTAVNKIVQLNLDVLFTLSPFNKEREVGSMPPVYLLSTEVRTIDITFQTAAIIDLSDMMDYFGQYRQSKFDYLERQRYNHLKPMVKLHQVKAPEGKKRLVKDWWIFLSKATKLELRSQKSKIDLTVRRSCTP